MPETQMLSIFRPFVWLARGFLDLLAMPGISFTYGLAFFVQACVTVGLLYYFEFSGFIFPTATAGAVLIGPVLAAGLYEASRRRQSGVDVHFTDVFIVTSTSPARLLGFMLMLYFIFIVWIVVALALVDIYLGDIPAETDLPALLRLLSSEDGIRMLTVGTLIGAIFAVVVFAMSAIAAPMLFDRDISTLTAIRTSLKSVRENVIPMLVWAALILLIAGSGLLAFGVGLIFAFPLLGHATWHAYVDAVKWTDI